MSSMKNAAKFVACAARMAILPMVIGAVMQVSAQASDLPTLKGACPASIPGWTGDAADLGWSSPC